MTNGSNLTAKAKINSNCRKLLVLAFVLCFALPTTNLPISGGQSDWEGTINYSPKQGPAGTRVIISGSGFSWMEDLGVTELLVRWDIEWGGPVLARAPLKGGSFNCSIVIPESWGEVPGTHGILLVYSYGGPVQTGSITLEFYITAGLITPQPTSSPTPKPGVISGVVEDGHGHRLPKVTVMQMWDFNDGRGPFRIASTHTDNQGLYQITSSQITVPMPPGTRGFLVVELSDEDRIIEIRDESVSLASIVSCEFGDVPRTEAAMEWFEIQTDADLNRNLIFPATASLALPLPNGLQYQPGHSDDNAITYYYAYLAVMFYRDELGVTFGFRGDCVHTPLLIRTWSPDDTAYHNDTPLWSRDDYISIKTDDSSFDDRDAPKNREWHEFSHYIMTEVYNDARVMECSAEENDDLNGNGNIEPNEYSDVNQNLAFDNDGNHGPVTGPHVAANNDYFNNLATTDSIVEGFAEFMGCVIADWAQKNNWHYRNDNEPPHHYPVSNSYRIEEERNTDSKQEEICVASILWDFYDDFNAAEKDQIQVPIQTLWSIIKSKYEFPKYYELVHGQTELRSWTGDTYVGGSDSQETETRNILHIKDLYDALVVSLYYEKNVIDDVFLWHDVVVRGEFFIDRNDNDVYEQGIDLWLPEFDLDGNNRYTAPNEQSTTNKTLTSIVRKFSGDRTEVITNTYEDFESGNDAINYIYPSDESLSLSVDVQGRLNGTYGLNMDFSVVDWAAMMIDKPLDATGTSSIQFWSKAPADVRFEAQLANQNSVWVSPMLQGTGQWKLYNIRYTELSLQPDITQTGSATFDKGNINYFVLNYTTIGSYTVYVDTITTDIVQTPTGITVTEDEEVTTQIIKGEPIIIYGIGSPGRAYRRNIQPTPGSFIQIKSDSLPATLNVKVDFNVPYDYLDYSYTVDITESPMDVNIIAPNDGTVTLTLDKPGSPTSQPLVINSTYFWNHVGKQDYLAVYGSESFNLLGFFSSWTNLIVVVIAVVVIIACITIFARTRKKNKSVENKPFKLPIPPPPPPY
jgi:hypothetical protein